MCHPDPCASPLLQKIPGSSSQLRNSDRGGRSTLESLGGAPTCPRVQARSKQSDGRLPDEPDFAGMRKRRAATSVQLTALKPKGARAVDAGKSDHELVLDAYGYGELAQLAWFMAAHAGNALQALGGLLVDWQLGPPVAECAKLAPATLSPTASATSS
ncbi:MAG: hypothetical protein JWP36_1800 [Paucimonas sp.]|nr:hypothetical protein [Paucimonas sp.]